MVDFEIIDYGSVYTIRAKSHEAKEFARENFPVAPWQGCAEDFQTDWRAARDLYRRLWDFGWEIRLTEK